MQDPAILIATSVTLLYALAGPLILLGIYVLFDILSKSDGPVSGSIPASGAEGDPALWQAAQIAAFLQERRGRP